MIRTCWKWLIIPLVINKLVVKLLLKTYRVEGDSSSPIVLFDDGETLTFYFQKWKKFQCFSGNIIDKPDIYWFQFEYHTLSEKEK